MIVKAMDRTFCFTLQEQEYVEYLSWQISHSKIMRGCRWFIMTSVPAVLITGALILKVRQWMFMCAIFALVALWILYGAAAVWKRFIRRKITGQVLPRMNIKEFREMRYHFGEKGISYSGKGRETKLAWTDILLLLPLENEFAFCYAGGAILIPYRVFADEEDKKQFLQDYMRIGKGTEKQ